MLNGAQNAAQAHKLNSDTRLKLSQDVKNLNDKIRYLKGESSFMKNNVLE